MLCFAEAQSSLDSMIDTQHARAPHNRHNPLHGRDRSQFRHRNHNVSHTSSYVFLSFLNRILGSLRSVRLPVWPGLESSRLVRLLTVPPLRTIQHLSTNARSKLRILILFARGLIFIAFTLRDNRSQCHSHHTHPQFCPYIHNDSFCLDEAGLRATRHQCCPCSHQGADSPTSIVEP